MLQFIRSFLFLAACGLLPRGLCCDRGPESHYMGNSRENGKAAYFFWHSNDCSGQAESRFVCVYVPLYHLHGWSWYGFQGLVVL